MTRKELNSRTYNAQNTAKAQAAKKEKQRIDGIITDWVTLLESKAVEEAEKGFYFLNYEIKDVEHWHILKRHKSQIPLLVELQAKFDEQSEEYEDTRYYITLNWESK